MKLKEIKTELFSRVSITDFGIRFESYDKKGHEAGKKRYPDMYYFVVAVNLLYDGSVTIQGAINRHLSFEQLQEVVRCAEILKQEKI